MQNKFSNQIKAWVICDNQVKIYQDKIKELRKKRGDIATDILYFVDTNNLKDTQIEISDGKLQFNKTKNVSPLTFKLVKQCLNKCIDDPSSVDAIINFIKENRSIKYIKDIKRSYTK